MNTGNLHECRGLIKTLVTYGRNPGITEVVVFVFGPHKSLSIDEQLDDA